MLRAAILSLFVAGLAGCAGIRGEWIKNADGSEVYRVYLDGEKYRDYANTSSAVLPAPRAPEPEVKGDDGKPAKPGRALTSLESRLNRLWRATFRAAQAEDWRSFRSGCQALCDVGGSLLRSGGGGGGSSGNGSARGGSRDRDDNNRGDDGPAIAGVKRRLADAERDLDKYLDREP